MDSIFVKPLPQDHPQSTFALTPDSCRRSGPFWWVRCTGAILLDTGLQSVCNLKVPSSSLNGTEFSFVRGPSIVHWLSRDTWKGSQLIGGVWSVFCGYTLSCAFCVCQFCGQAPSFFPSVFALDLPVVSILCSVLLVFEILSKMLWEFLTRNMSMEGGCELLGIKKKMFPSSFFFQTFMIYLWSVLIHAFICSLFFFLIQYRWDGRPCAGSKGTIPSLRRIHSLVSEIHASAVTVQMGRSFPSQKCAEGATVGPAEERVTHLGWKDVGSFWPKELLSAHIIFFSDLF